MQITIHSGGGCASIAEVAVDRVESRGGEVMVETRVVSVRNSLAVSPSLAMRIRAGGTG